MEFRADDDENDSSFRTSQYDPNVPDDDHTFWNKSKRTHPFQFQPPLRLSGVTMNNCRLLCEFKQFESLPHAELLDLSIQIIVHSVNTTGDVATRYIRIYPNSTLPASALNNAAITVNWDITDELQRAWNVDSELYVHSDSYALNTDHEPVLRGTHFASEGSETYPIGNTAGILDNLLNKTDYNGVELWSVLGIDVHCLQDWQSSNSTNFLLD